MNIKTFKPLIASIFFSTNMLAQNTLVYVSTKGNDKAAGTLQAPLKSIRAALELIKKNDNTQDVEIVLRQGVYEQDTTLEINRDNVSIHPYKNEEVIISGGKTLSPKALKRIRDKEVMSYIQPQCREHIREIDMTACGIPLHGLRASGFGRPSIPAWTEPFLNGQPMHVSRWPNDSTVPIGKIYESGADKKAFPVFGYEEHRPSEWKETGNMWIGGYFAHGYADDMIRVAKIDTLNRTIHTAQHTVYGFMTGAPWRQWVALNLIEELDSPGEYVIDEHRNKIYVYMPDQKITKLQVTLLDAPIIAIEHCKNVTLKGLTLEHGRQIGIYMEDTHAVTVKECVVRNMGGTGIVVGKGSMECGNIAGHQHGGEAVTRIVGDLQGKIYEDILFNREGGTKNGIVDCHIYNVGAGGISLGGGDRTTLTPAGNYVENCRIHDYNRIEKSYRPGVWMDGVGNRVSKCNIYDAPSMAILFHGNNHMIEYCDITNVCSEVDDQGAIYYGRDPSEQGHVIRYCYFHELSPRHRVTATYHDDGACGSEVYGNIYYKAGSLPALIGGGHHHHYKNNLFIDSPVAIHVDNRMQNWGKSMLEKGGIVDRRLKDVNFQKSPYSTIYPLLSTYWDDTPDYPHGNVIEGNLFYKIGNVINGRTEWLEMYNNWTTNYDPGFVDINYPLKGFRQDAPIYQHIKNFPQLPVENIGCNWNEEDRM